MRRIIAFIVAAFALVVGVEAAHAAIQVHVDIARQRMVVKENGSTVAVWSVSTARSGKITPAGQFRPYTMRRSHFSSLYNNAPMPHAIFFRGHYAIHGTNQVRRLGSPASAGCIRLSPANAARLFAMVERHGMSRTRISITRSLPSSSALAQEMDRGRNVAVAAAEAPARRAVHRADRQERQATQRSTQRTEATGTRGTERRVTVARAVERMSGGASSGSGTGGTTAGGGAASGPTWDGGGAAFWPPNARLRGALN